ncbi:putative phospholipid-transporting ATPase, partial [Zancudomyces culisetae]
MMAIVQLIPYFKIGPAWAAVLPLLSVLALTAFKDAVEDWRRHISDNRLNNIKTKVIKNVVNKNIIDDPLNTCTKQSSIFGSIFDSYADSNNNSISKTWLSDIHNQTTGGSPIVRNFKWKDVRVGDLIYITENNQIPADILILSSAHDNGACFVDTKDLDGETNLKSRSSLDIFKEYKGIEGVVQLRLVAEADSPTADLQDANGKIKILEKGRTKTVGYNMNNMILRGMVLRNTEWTIGL